MFFRLFLMFKLLTAKRIIIRFITVSVWSLSFVAYSAVAMADHARILVYGDSLSAAYGIAQQQGWVTLLQTKLLKQQYHYAVVNASVSGETTSGGLSGFAANLATSKPAIVILELGANDGLRGLPIKEMQANLSTMIQLSKKAGAKVLLLGMQIPPNYGPQYTQSFRLTYPELSQQYQTGLVPFMLDNVAANPKLIQDDGLHPNALGQPIVLENIWPHLQLLLKK